LKELANLSYLDVGGTQVTDAGLNDLKELKNLSSLYLGRTQVTNAGIDELRKALPKCKITK
jgi:Leucine-rich repeat (LRR) protein